MYGNFQQVQCIESTVGDGRSDIAGSAEPGHLDGMYPALRLGHIIDPYTYPPRGLDLAAARYLGLDPDAFSNLVESGKLPHHRRLGEAAVWDRMALDIAFEAIPVGEEPAQPNDGGSAPTPLVRASLQSGFCVRQTTVSLIIGSSA